MHGDGMDIWRFFGFYGDHDSVLMVGLDWTKDGWSVVSKILDFFFFVLCWMSGW